jgi:hypothetical protein
MTDTPDVPITPNGESAGQERTSPRWAMIAGIVVIVAALVAALFLFADSDDDETSDPVPTGATTDVDRTTTPTDTTVQTTAPPTTTETPATTEVVETTAPATTEVSPAPDDAVRTAIWPWVETDTRYTDPVEAATGFATDFLLFDEPIVGAFMAGDSRSGEVEVQSFADGPVTVVFVRQLTDDDSWWILGAASENIVVDEPEALAEVDSPLTVSGTALAFEGTVDVQLRADGNGEPIFEGFVTASGGPEPGPFTETLEFISPGETGGALVMLSLSSENGSVIEASALRVFYR